MILFGTCFRLSVSQILAEMTPSSNLPKSSQQSMQLKDPSIMSCKGQTPRHNNNTSPESCGQNNKSHCIVFLFFFPCGRGGGEGLPHYVSGLAVSECGIWILGSMENKEYSHFHFPFPIPVSLTSKRSVENEVSVILKVNKESLIP